MPKWTVTLILVSSLALSAGASRCSAPSSALSLLAFNLGTSVSVGKVMDEDFIYGCAKVPDCADGCKASLEQFTDRGGALCPEIARMDGDNTREKAKAFVMRRLTEAGHASSPSEPRDRDRLDCGLGRLGLGPSRPEACVREEARTVADSLGQLSRYPTEQETKQILFWLCSELEGCSNGCPDLMYLVASIDWNKTDVIELARTVSKSRCPDLGIALLKEPRTEAPDRAYAWGLARVSAFVASACAMLGPPERSVIACSLERLGVVTIPITCGVPTACPPQKRPSTIPAIPKKVTQSLKP